MNNQENFTARSSKLKVHRANSQTISTHLVRLSIDILFSSLVSFAFCFCLLLALVLFCNLWIPIFLPVELESTPQKVVAFKHFMGEII